MRVMVNLCRGYVISSKYDEEQISQPWEQLRQRGRRNVTSHGDRGMPQQPPPQFEGGVSIKSFQSWVGTYLANLHGGVNYHNQAIDILFSHLNVERPPTMPPHYPYIPTWEELWSRQGDGIWLSGARNDGDDDH